MQDDCFRNQVIGVISLKNDIEREKSTQNDLYMYSFIYLLLYL